MGSTPRWRRHRRPPRRGVSPLPLFPCLLCCCCCLPPPPPSPVAARVQPAGSLVQGHGLWGRLLGAEDAAHGVAFTFQMKSARISLLDSFFSRGRGRLLLLLVSRARAHAREREADEKRDCRRARTGERRNREAGERMKKSDWSEFRKRERSESLPSACLSHSFDLLPRSFSGDNLIRVRSEVTGPPAKAQEARE